MKRLLLLVLLSVTIAAFAGESPRRLEQAILVDDDDGRVEAINLAPARGALAYHGGAVIARPSVVALFVGDSWESSANAALKAHLLAHLRSFGGSAEFGETHRLGIDVTGVAITSAAASAPAGNLSDLDVQHVLASSLRAGAIPSVDERTVVAVLLAPEVRSHIGSQQPQLDYLGYHSHVQIDDVPIHYVVIPCELDEGSLRPLVSRSLLRTILNPDGNGWY